MCLRTVSPRFAVRPPTRGLSTAEITSLDRVTYQYIDMTSTQIPSHLTSQVADILNTSSSSKEAIFVMRKFMSMDQSTINEETMLVMALTMLELGESIREALPRYFFLLLKETFSKLKGKLDETYNPRFVVLMERIEGTINKAGRSPHAPAYIPLDICKWTNDYELITKICESHYFRKHADYTYSDLQTVREQMERRWLLGNYVLLNRYFSYFGAIGLFTFLRQRFRRRRLFFLMPAKLKLPMGAEYEDNVNQLMKTILMNCDKMATEALGGLFFHLIENNYDDAKGVVRKLVGQMYLNLVHELLASQDSDQAQNDYAERYRYFTFSLIRFFLALPVVEKMGIEVSFMKYKILSRLIFRHDDDLAAYFPCDTAGFLLLKDIDTEKALLYLEVLIHINRSRASIIDYVTRLSWMFRKLPESILERISGLCSYSQSMMLENYVQASRDPTIALQTNFLSMHVLSLDGYSDAQRKNYIQAFVSYVEAKALSPDKVLDPISSLRILTYYKHDRQGFDGLLDKLYMGGVRYMSVKQLNFVTSFTDKYHTTGEEMALLWRLINLNGNALEALDEFIELNIKPQIDQMRPTKGDHPEVEEIARTLNATGQLLDKSRFEHLYVYLCYIEHLEAGVCWGEETVNFLNRHLEGFDEDYIFSTFIQPFLTVLVKKMHADGNLKSANLDRFHATLKNEKWSEKDLLLRSITGFDGHSSRNIILKDYLDYSLYNLSAGDLSALRAATISQGVQDIYDESEDTEE